MRVSEKSNLEYVPFIETAESEPRIQHIQEPIGSLKLKWLIMFQKGQLIIFFSIFWIDYSEWSS